MSMNLALKIDGRIDRDEIDLYQTETATTRLAMRGDPYETYASFVREIFADELAEMRASWHHDELEIPHWEHHLRHVALLIAFRSARFVEI